MICPTDGVSPINEELELVFKSASDKTIKIDGVFKSPIDLLQGMCMHVPLTCISQAILWKMHRYEFATVSLGLVLAVLSHDCSLLVGTTDKNIETQDCCLLLLLLLHGFQLARSCRLGRTLQLQGH